MAAPHYYAAFRGAVETLFNNWTALQLAVDQGMGGNNARNNALQMVDYISEYCCTTRNVDEMDVAVLLEEIMDETFDTVCEDDSPQELSSIIIRFLRLCQSNNQEQMLLELSQLPTCKLWLCQPQVQITIPIQSHEVVVDEDDGDEPEGGQEGQDEAMEEDPDPGWTVVKTRKK